MLRSNISNAKRMMGTLVLLALGLSACGHNSAETTPVTFLVFGDSGYSYEFMPSWYSEGVFATAEEFELGFREYWESVKKRELPHFEVPPYYYHEDLQGYVHASGLQLVATSMQQECRRTTCSFALMLGDNIYPEGATLGIDGFDDDRRFEAMLTRPFSGLGDLRKDFNIYTALGNHDWGTSREGAMRQLEFLQTTRPFYADGLYYRVRPPGLADAIELFVIDTDLILAEADVVEYEISSAGEPEPTGKVSQMSSWIRPSNDYERHMLDWLEESLKSSTATWKIVVGHHPLWSSGGTKVGENEVMRRDLRPILCRYADAYFAGHDHTLEVHTDNCKDIVDAPRGPLLHAVSGAAARLSPINDALVAYRRVANPTLNQHFVAGMEWGYMAIDIVENEAQLRINVVKETPEGPMQEEVYRQVVAPRTLLN